MNNPALPVSEPDEINTLLWRFSQKELFPFHVMEGEVLVLSEGAVFFLMEGVMEIRHTHSRRVIDVIDRVSLPGL